MFCYQPEQLAAAAAALAAAAAAQAALVPEVRMQLQVVELQQVALAQRKNQLEQMLLQLGGGVAGAGLARTGPMLRVGGGARARLARNGPGGG